MAVASDLPWARRRSVSIRALTGGAGGPYLTRERDAGTRAAATASLAAHGATLTPALEVASIQGLKRMIASGGFSILSRLAITNEVRAGTLLGGQLRAIDLSRELRAIRLARRRRPTGGATPAGGSAAARFWAWLTTRAHGETAAGAHAPA